MSSDGHHVPSIGHDVAHRSEVSVVHIGTVEGDDHPHVEEQGLAGGFDAQDVEDLHDVIALQTVEVHLGKEHHFFHVHSVGVQHPLLRTLELPRLLVVLVHIVFTHEDLFNAFNALQGHLLEDVCLHIPQKLEVLVLRVVVGVVWPWHSAYLVRFLQQSNPQHQFLCVVVSEDTVQVVHEVVQDTFTHLSHGELLVRHDLVAQLDAQEPGSTTFRILILVRELVVQADPFLVLFHQSVLRVWIPENLSEGGHLLQSGVLQHALHILGSFLDLSQLALQENGQGWCLHFLGDVDQLLQSWNSQGHILGSNSGEMEGVQSHLRGWLTDTLCCQCTNHLTWMSQ
mmetsp:Transcript_19552/g.31823  ORF Transcript_19552/g.31823 Transcript_19552/m.31823 type:complete len:341 (+) Transcript_19552:1226-2248(+)